MSAPLADRRQCSRTATGLPLPAYQSAGAAGTRSFRGSGSGGTIDSAARRHGVCPDRRRARIPDGYEGQVRPRPGIAANAGVTVLNAPGTIDSDYRGEISVLLINLGAEPFEIVRGARIAQLVFAPGRPGGAFRVGGAR